VMLLQTQVIMKKSNSLNNFTNNNCEDSYSHYLKPIVRNTQNSTKIQHHLKTENAKLYFSSINCLNWSANFCANNGKENKSPPDNKSNDMSRTRSLFFKKPPYNNQKALSIKIIEKKSMNRISLFSNRCEDQIPTLKRHCDFSDKLTYI
jgi:hypothetical protein